jgi:cardiolipin synthase
MLLELRQLPNAISALRVLLVAPIAWCLWHHELEATLALMMLAGVSDLLDGFLARRFGWQSRLGAVLDPVGDKLLLVTLFVMLALMHEVPVWLVATVLARELVLVSGAVVYRVWLGPFEIRPSPVSKLNTLIEALYVLAVIAHAAFGAPPPPAIMALGALAFGTVVVSGIDYVLRYSRRALETARAPLPSASGAKLR